MPDGPGAASASGADRRYCDLPREHPESYHSFMWESLFRHIDIQPQNVNILDGNAHDYDAECRQYEAKMKARLLRLVEASSDSRASSQA